MKRIPLSKRGKCEHYAIVDDEDYEQLAQFNWSNGGKYAVREARKHEEGYRKNKRIAMHRVLAGAGEGQHVDHINGNPLDNRKANLRVCTHKQNARNCAATKGAASRYRGVSWRKDREKWSAQIHVDRKKINLGVFNDERQAAKVFDAAAVEMFGEYARLNFPDEPPTEPWQTLSERYRREQKVSRGSASGYRGVVLHKASGLWQAIHRVDGYLGYFKDEAEAAAAVDAAERKHFGAEGRYNLPS